MKSTIDHLPEHKQAELFGLVEAIKRRLPVEMVILFGSYARGDWVEDRYIENGITYEYKSDYDILAVLDTEALAIRHESNKRWQSKLRRDTRYDTTLNVIFHGIEYLNSEIENGNYFFLDVLKDGIMLFNSGKYKLSAPKKLTPIERRNKAQKYYDKSFNSAREFLIDFTNALRRASYCNAAFLLHQVTEQLFMCLLLVYTDYKPKEHDLEKLNHKAVKQDQRLKAVFPQETDEEKRLFTVLKKAYIDARYKLDYSVNREDLEYLSERVDLLRNVIEMSCKEKIDSFEINNESQEVNFTI